MKGLKIHVIILACVLTLGIALGGQRLYYRHRVTAPLLARIEAVAGVTDARFAQAGNTKQVVVSISDSVDLPTVYKAAGALVREALGDDGGSLVVQDNRDQHLTATYYRMHYHVQQGIATGLFTQMAAGIDAIARQDGLTAHEVYVDQHNVYVKLQRDSRYLYEIIPRPQIVAQAPPVQRKVSTW